MQHFYNKISEVKDLAEGKSLARALKLLDETFRILIYEEREEPLVLDGKAITAVDIARKITQSILDLPEIEENQFTQETMNTVRMAIEDYLQDRIGPDAFWAAMVELGRLIYFLQGISEYLHKKRHPLGKSASPALSIALEEDGSMQLYAKIADDGLSMEQAFSLQDSFKSALDNENASAYEMINLAGKLLTSQKFEEAIELYEKIILRFPNETPQCLNAIGACQYYLENYETAIDYYIKALEAGELRSRVEYNVWESCQSIIVSSNDKKDKMKWLFFFDEHFPGSSYSLNLD